MNYRIRRHTPIVTQTFVNDRLTFLDEKAGFEALIKFLEEHRIEPIVEATYTFDDLPKAFEHFDQNPFGKIVVMVSER